MTVLLVRVRQSHTGVQSRVVSGGGGFQWAVPPPAVRRPGRAGGEWVGTVRLLRLLPPSCPWASDFPPRAVRFLIGGVEKVHLTGVSTGFPGPRAVA